MNDLDKEKLRDTISEAIFCECEPEELVYIDPERFGKAVADAIFDLAHSGSEENNQ